MINSPGAKFCSDCGTALGGTTAPPTPARPTAAPPPQTAAPVAERRLVSVLFADLVGFTPFAEERDAEDVRETLTRYFDMARETSSGATAARSRSSSATRSWPCGAHRSPTRTTPSGPSARRSSWSTPCQRLAAGIQARAGVLTGEAAVTIGATNQGMVAGDLVNTASRLQSRGAAGQPCWSARRRIAPPAAAIAFEAAGEQVLKGKQAPVPAWRALRVVAERGGRNRAEALEAPFVGRDGRAPAAQGPVPRHRPREARARRVASSGRPASARAALAWEFLKYIDGLVETVYWHSGRSPAYGEGITFWALGEMVRERAGLAETDDEPTTRDEGARDGRPVGHRRRRADLDRDARC